MKFDLSKVKRMIEESQNMWGGFNIDRIIEGLKGTPLVSVQKAYIAQVLDYQARSSLFEKLKFDDELSEANMADEVLFKSKETRGSNVIYNLYKVANNWRTPPTEFGMEYIGLHLSKNALEKLGEIRPDFFKVKEPEEEEAQEEEEAEEREEEESKEEPVKEETEHKEEIPIIESKKTPS